VVGEVAEGEAALEALAPGLAQGGLGEGGEPGSRGAVGEAVGPPQQGPDHRGGRLVAAGLDQAVHRGGLTEWSVLSTLSETRFPRRRSAPAP